MKEIGPFQEQLISLAEVRSRIDGARMGSFLAQIEALDNDEKRVYYVSPYGSNNTGGFVAIPEEGTKILVVRPTGSNNWYYLGTTFDFEPIDPSYGGAPIKDGHISPVERVNPDIYKAQGVPMRYTFVSPAGAGLEISDDENPSYMKKFVKLRGATGKKIVIDDTPSNDSITLDSGNNSKIVISANPDNMMTGRGAASIEVTTNGPQKYINHESQTDLYIGGGGRELQLLNAANGMLTPLPNYPVPLRRTGIEGEFSPIKPSGNVNIQSKHRDVNVFTQGLGGRIFIECLNALGADQQIVIETNGVGGGITIKTNGRASIQALEGIDISTMGNINMGCTQFNLTCTAGMNVQAGPVMNLDAGVVNIAPPAPVVPVLPFASIPIVPPVCVPEIPFIRDVSQQSDYGNAGVRTYSLF